MATAYERLPALVAANPGHTSGFYSAALQISNQSVLKALARLANDGALVSVPSTGGRLLWYTDEGIDLPPPVQTWCSCWEPAAAPPGPRSIFDLAACVTL